MNSISAIWAVSHFGKMGFGKTGRTQSGFWTLKAFRLPRGFIDQNINRRFRFMTFYLDLPRSIHEDKLSREASITADYELMLHKIRIPDFEGLQVTPRIRTSTGALGVWFWAIRFTWIYLDPSTKI